MEAAMVHPELPETVGGGEPGGGGGGGAGGGGGGGGGGVTLIMLCPIPSPRHFLKTRTRGNILFDTF